MSRLFLPLFIGASLLLGACESVPSGADLPATTEPDGTTAAKALDDSYEFATPVFDIAATPDGSILVAESPIIKEINRRGIQDVAVLPTVEGSPVNGLATTGRRSFFATSGGLDLAVGAGVWHVSNGRATLIGDVEAFEIENDPDANAGIQWKDQRCEAIDGFSEGPQTNPYHLAALSGSEVLVADAAGNSLLWAKKNRQLELAAVFTPPTEDGTGSTNPDDWLVRWVHPDGIDCYVQPVPTSVAIAPDGAYYVGELTGNLTEADFLLDPETLADMVRGLSRVWRIEPGARDVTCPSDECTVAVSGLTSVIDVAFGPDDRLYVLENDLSGWFSAILGNGSGGRLSSCDVSSGALAASDCAIVEEDLGAPGAITFDKWANLWIVEADDAGMQVVRTVDWN